MNAFFNTTAIIGAVEQGLMYSLLALGLFLSYRILGLADLTVDGSFAFGGAVSAVLTFNGHPYLAIVMCFIAGCCAGFVTAFLQTKIKLQPIIAGILVMTSLYTINLWVMNKRTPVQLIGKNTIFTPLVGLIGKTYAGILIGGTFSVICLIFVILLLKTPFGMALRATGNNEDMVRSSSINVDFVKTVGLMLANGLVALSGGLLAQSQGSADISMGSGMVVIGLASLIIGEVIFFGRNNVTKNAVVAILGSILYRIIITLVLYFNIDATDLKLISSVIVFLAISLPVLKRSYAEYKNRTAMKRHSLIVEGSDA